MKNLNLETLNQTSLNRLAGFLGIEIKELAPGKVKATMPVDNRHHQPMGLLHGGASVTLAETVASIGGWYLVAEEGKVVVGQEINANHLRPITSGTVTAEGNILHQGKSSQVWEIKIYDEKRELICASRCTLAVVISP